MTCFVAIKKRADFLAVRGGAKVSTPGFLIEAKRRKPHGTGIETSAARFGLTVTKKLGNAVRRNRIKRRLRAAIAGSNPASRLAGVDYVIVARAAAFDRPFASMSADLANALKTLSLAAAVDRQTGSKKG